MKPHSKKGFICLKMMMKIPMTVFGGLQYKILNNATNNEYAFQYR